MVQLSFQSFSTLLDLIFQLLEKLRTSHMQICVKMTKRYFLWVEKDRRVLNRIVFVIVQKLVINRLTWTWWNRFFSDFKNEAFKWQLILKRDVVSLHSRIFDNRLNRRYNVHIRKFNRKRKVSTGKCWGERIEVHLRSSLLNIIIDF